ncbi:MAG: DUF72 domain-containing protein [Rudaea sp.]
MAGHLRIGTSGWVYNHWREIFYPKGLPQRAWFAHYATVFDTVEINNSFYRLPTDATFEKWRRQAPPGFVYSVKASRYLTHIRRLKEPEEPLKTFIDAAAHLGPTLGPLLYQLPPRWGVDLPRLERFLSILPPGYLHVVEFRDPSWLIEAVFALLERYGVAHCLHDSRGLPVPRRVTAQTVYIRFHGDRTNGGDYTDAHLQEWAADIERWRDAGHDVFAYFNNDPHGWAIKNANTLKAMLGLGEKRDAGRLM